MTSVSIITTTFDRVGYLREALQSALSQTFADFEIIVADDGGKPQSKQLCEELDDPRIRHVVNPSRLGIAMNTYSAIMQSRSDLIAILNDDDKWAPDFLEKCATSMLVFQDVVLTFSDHWIIDSAGSRLDAETDENTIRWGRNRLAAGRVADPARLLVENSVPLAMASVFRKSAIEWTMFSPKVAGAYDFFLSYCLVRNGGGIVYVPERLTEYRAHGGSATAQFHVSNVLGSSYICELIMRDPNLKSIVREMSIRDLNQQRHLIKQYLRQGKILSALSCLPNAIRPRYSL